MPKISKSVRVDRSLEDLASLLGTRPPDWLIPFASIAVHTGEAAGARRAGVSATSGPRRARRIVIDLDDVPQHDAGSRVDAGIRWEASGFRWTFSSFNGRIVATRESVGSCEISIEGDYELPASVKGNQGRRSAAVAADTAAQMLLSTLKDAVEEQARTGA